MPWRAAPAGAARSTRRNGGGAAAGGTAMLIPSSPPKGTGPVSEPRSPFFALCRPDCQRDVRPVFACLQELDLALFAAAFELDLGVDLFVLGVLDLERVLEGVLVSVEARVDLEGEGALDHRRWPLGDLAGVHDLRGLREPSRKCR